MRSSSTTDSPASNENPQYLIGGAIDPRYYTTTGAFNGSGIALATNSFTNEIFEGTEGVLVMYFQHHTGEIRWTQLSNDGSWNGGSASEVVATDAKNSTPLSTVSYISNDVTTWHVFCKEAQ